MSKQVVYTSPGILGFLGIAFVILKLTNVIDWSWWWVTLPFWGPITFLFLSAFIILTISGIILVIKYHDDE